LSLTSLAFAAFALGVLGAARVSGRRLRWVVLLAASYAFYAAWGPILPAILAAVTLASYGAARVLDRESGPSPRRRVAMWAGVSSAVGALLVLKYGGLLATMAEGAAAALAGRDAHTTFSPFVHVGVSYWALQAISYVVDVSLGVVPAERHLGRYALYLAFFPKLVQGPIERAGRFLPQVEEPGPLRAADLLAALPLVVWGAFQKLVVADRLAPFVDSVFGDPDRYGGLSVLVATYLFAGQLYFDFAGYTCIAIGAGRALGIRLSPNFDAPYAAASVSEFWRRWHMSFSSWILDYVFRPVQLGLRRWRTLGTSVALLVTFGFSGLWHGATWGFVAWGLLHGVYLSASVLLAGPRRRVRDALGIAGSRLYRPLRVLLTFHLVCLAWVFFRAPTLGEALALLARATTGLPASLVALARGGARHVICLDQEPDRLFLALALVGAAAVLPRLLPELRPAAGGGAEPTATGRAAWGRAVAYSVLLYLVAFLGGSTQAFIYARF